MWWCSFYEVNEIIMFHLTFPNISHRSRYLDMIEEWKSHEIPTSPSALFRGETFDEFLDITTTYVTASPNHVNSTLFFFMNDEEILWALNLRHHIDHPWLSLEGWWGGHIGYGLRPSARGRWLAKEMLKLWLIEAWKLGIERVFISADEDNPASWRTIESCGGVLYNIKEKEGKNLKIYSINLWN